jgi:hypothetical protein
MAQAHPGLKRIYQCVDRRNISGLAPARAFLVRVRPEAPVGLFRVRPVRLRLLRGLPEPREPRLLLELQEPRGPPAGRLAAGQRRSEVSEAAADWLWAKWVARQGPQARWELQEEPR